MSKNINLIRNDKTGLASANNKHIVLRITAVIILFTVSFLSVMMFILIALSPLPSLKETEKSESTQLSYFNDLIVKVLLTKDRLTQVNKLINSRPVYSKSLQFIQKYLTADSTIEEVNLKEKIVSVTVASTNLQPLAILTDDIKRSNDLSKSFKDITLESLYYDDNKQKYLLIIDL
jgi:hypothetical protein